jgi:hypothetical protein
MEGIDVLNFVHKRKTDDEGVYFMRKIMVLFLIISILFPLSIVAMGEGATRTVGTVPSNLSEVEVLSIQFELPQEKSKIETERNRNSITYYFNERLKTQKDICFGIYAGNDSNKIVLQLVG